MNSDKSDVQVILVDVPKYDKDGNPISLDSLSSGGARKPGGTFIVQYRNPRLPKSANQHQVDELVRRKNDVLRRREEEAEERRRRDRAERTTRFVLDNVAKPLVQQFFIPLAKELWDTKVLPEGKRRAQRLRRQMMGQPEVPQASGDTLEFADEIVNPLAASQHIADHASELSTVQERGEDTPLADVIQMDDYQNRKSVSGRSARLTSWEIEQTYPTGQSPANPVAPFNSEHGSDRSVSQLSCLVSLEVERH